MHSAALVRRFYDEVWNRADEIVARRILHPALTFRASLGPTRSGPDGFISYMRAIHAALGDYFSVIDELIATNDRAAARMTFSGIHRATLFGVPPTGKRIAWSGAAFFTIADQRIKDIWVLGDIDSVKQQLGAAATATFA
jgi:steroid delta-isomerase-like uncharacterized protein